MSKEVLTACKEDLERVTHVVYERCGKKAYVQMYVRDADHCIHWRIDSDMLVNVPVTSQAMVIGTFLRVIELFTGHEFTPSECSPMGTATWVRKEPVKK